jgi:hypothetical protein
MLSEINHLRSMSVDQLRQRWRELYSGEESRSRNKPFLYRRLAWRIQELRYGGLSDRAKARLAELMPVEFTRARTPIVPDPAVAAHVGRSATVRDLRLPTPGSVISRRWRGKDLRLLVRETGFELDGVVHGSLSEAARAVTGQRWSGPLFWGLRQRSRKS